MSVSRGSKEQRTVCPDGFFRDVVNTTPSEVRSWASKNYYLPDQDWNVMIWLDDDLLPIFIELAQDEDCPNQIFFLELLYGRVGDAVRRRGGVDRVTVEMVSQLAGS